MVKEFINFQMDLYMKVIFKTVYFMVEVNQLTNLTQLQSFQIFKKAGHMDKEKLFMKIRVYMKGN